MDEGLLLNRMVQILFQHPAEWFTFKRMANTVHLPGIDANLIGALLTLGMTFLRLTKIVGSSSRPLLLKRFRSRG